MAFRGGRKALTSPRTRPMEWSYAYQERDTVALRRSGKKVATQIHLQGKLAIFKRVTLQKPYPTLGNRTEIKSFSQGSRFRLLKEIARIKWDHVPNGIFVTLTYPDDKAAVTLDEANMHRHHFFRHTEKYLSDKVPILWRKEMQVRKSGEHTGKAVAHYHLAIFANCFIPHELIRTWWRQTIKATGPLATDVKAMDSGEHAAFYLAKYMSKKDAPPSLDNLTYLTKPGRAWGWHRKKLMPKCPQDSFVGITDQQWEAVMEQVMAIRPALAKQETESFTLLGPDAVEAAKIVNEILY